MSAKLGAITQVRPWSSSAHGACSREEPQPKFSLAMRIEAFEVGRPVEDEVRIGRAVGLGLEVEEEALCYDPRARQFSGTVSG